VGPTPKNRDAKTREHEGPQVVSVDRLKNFKPIRLALVGLGVVLGATQLQFDAAELPLVSVLLAPFAVSGALVGVICVRRSRRTNHRAIVPEMMVLAGTVAGALAVLLIPTMTPFGILLWPALGDVPDRFRTVGVFSNGILQSLLLSVLMIRLGAAELQ
jgi:hypothetical protein